MELRPVLPEHRRDLEAFACARPHDEVALEIQQIIRQDVAGHLEADVVQAVGSWSGDELGALIVFADRGWVWKVDVLASVVRYQRRKQGARLMKDVRARAGVAGARVLLMRVHRENVPMRSLVRMFGGVEDSPPDESSPYLVCTVLTT